MLRASRLLATSGGTTTSRAAAATTSRAATTATKRISATERAATSARWRGTLDAVARTARAQAGSSVATSARWRRALHEMARTPMLPACALATITLARPPANCEVAVAVPREAMPQKNWRVARTLGGWSLRVAPVALWAPFAVLMPVFEKVVVAPRPLRDRGLRPDGREARAVVGDAARRLPRGLVRTSVAESSSPRWRGGRRDDSAERAAAIASTALVGVEA